MDNPRTTGAGNIVEIEQILEQVGKDPECKVFPPMGLPAPVSRRPGTS
jgi:hypothetical protein